MRAITQAQDAEQSSCEDSKTQPRYTSRPLRCQHPKLSQFVAGALPLAINSSCFQVTQVLLCLLASNAPILTHMCDCRICFFLRPPSGFHAMDRQHHQAPSGRTGYAASDAIQKQTCSTHDLPVILDTVSSSQITKACVLPFAF